MKTPKASELVKALNLATFIVSRSYAPNESKEAAFPLILQELLDCDYEDDLTTGTTTS